MAPDFIAAGRNSATAATRSDIFVIFILRMPLADDGPSSWNTPSTSPLDSIWNTFLSFIGTDHA